MIRSALAVAAACLFSTAAPAAIVLTATLTNGQESPPAVPTTVTDAPRASNGTATFILNDDRTAMSFTVEVFGIDLTTSQSADLNDNLTNAHIHAGTTATPPRPVVWGFLGTPFNNTSPNDGVLTPFASGVGGTYSGVWNLTEGQNTTLTAQLDNILAGRSYINFHTVQFPGGEIRGTLVPVPEPATAGMLVCGALALLFQASRRRRIPRALRD